MRVVCDVINAVFDVLLYPLGWLPPFWGLLFVSLLSGIGMILVFRAVSDQDKIAAIRRRMGGEVLGILLHVSSPGTVLKFAGRLIWSNTVYLSYLLKPLLVIAVPFMLVWGQLEARYGSTGFEEGIPVTLTVGYEAEQPLREDLDIQVTGADLLPPVMIVDTLDQVSFRIVYQGEGPARLSMGGITVPLGRSAEWNGSRMLSGFDASPSLFAPFTPGTVSIKSAEGGPDYGWYSLPDTDFSIFGWRWSFIAVFLVFSMLSALAGAKLMRIKV